VLPDQPDPLLREIFPSRPKCTPLRASKEDVYVNLDKEDIHCHDTRPRVVRVSHEWKGLQMHGEGTGIADNRTQQVRTALTGLMSTIANKPECARAVFRASSRLEEGVRCSVRVRDFDPLVVDEPAELGGGDAGMNPVELVLAALGACQEIMYAAYASVLGMDLGGVEVECKGELDLRGLFGLGESVPPGFTKIRYETKIASLEDEEKIRTLVHLVESRCPVLDILARPVAVSGTTALNGRTLAVREAAKHPAAA